MGLLSRISTLFSKARPRMRDFDQSSSLQEAPSDWALPPLSSQEAQAVLSQSEWAALEADTDDPDRVNPHPLGSREHRFWADNFKAVQRGAGKKR